LNLICKRGRIRHLIRRQLRIRKRKENLFREQIRESKMNKKKKENLFGNHIRVNEGIR
jgi:hypothetical protein